MPVCRRVLDSSRVSLEDTVWGPLTAAASECLPGAAARLHFVLRDGHRKGIPVNKMDF